MDQALEGQGASMARLQGITLMRRCHSGATDGRRSVMFRPI